MKKILYLLFIFFTVLNAAYADPVKSEEPKTESDYNPNVTCVFYFNPTSERCKAMKEKGGDDIKAIKAADPTYFNTCITSNCGSLEIDKSGISQYEKKMIKEKGCQEIEVGDATEITSEDLKATEWFVPANTKKTEEPAFLKDGGKYQGRVKKIPYQIKHLFCPAMEREIVTESDRVIQYPVMCYKDNLTNDIPEDLKKCLEENNCSDQIMKDNEDQIRNLNKRVFWMYCDANENGIVNAKNPGFPDRLSEERQKRCNRPDAADLRCTQSTACNLTSKCLATETVEKEVIKPGYCKGLSRKTEGPLATQQGDTIIPNGPTTEAGNPVGAQSINVLTTLSDPFMSDPDCVRTNTIVDGRGEKETTIRLANTYADQINIDSMIYMEKYGKTELPTFLFEAAPDFYYKRKKRICVFGYSIFGKWLETKKEEEVAKKYFTETINPVLEAGNIDFVKQVEDVTFKKRKKKGHFLSKCKYYTWMQSQFWNKKEVSDNQMSLTDPKANDYFWDRYKRLGMNFNVSIKLKTGPENNEVLGVYAVKPKGFGNAKTVAAPGIRLVDTGKGGDVIIPSDNYNTVKNSFSKNKLTYALLVMPYAGCFVYDFYDNDNWQFSKTHCFGKKSIGDVTTNYRLLVPSDNIEERNKLIKEYIDKGFNDYITQKYQASLVQVDNIKKELLSIFKEKNLEEIKTAIKNKEYDLKKIPQFANLILERYIEEKILPYYDTSAYSWNVERTVKDGDGNTYTDTFNESFCDDVNGDGEEPDDFQNKKEEYTYLRNHFKYCLSGQYKQNGPDYTYYHDIKGNVLTIQPKEYILKELENTIYEIEEKRLKEMAVKTEEYYNDLQKQCKPVEVALENKVDGKEATLSDLKQQKEAIEKMQDSADKDQLLENINNQIEIATTELNEAKEKYSICENCCDETNSDLTDETEYFLDNDNIRYSIIKDEYPGLESVQEYGNSQIEPDLITKIKEEIKKTTTAKETNNYKTNDRSFGIVKAISDYVATNVPPIDTTATANFKKFNRVKIRDLFNKEDSAQKDIWFPKYGTAEENGEHMYIEDPMDFYVYAAPSLDKRNYQCYGEWDKCELADLPDCTLDKVKYTQWIEDRTMNKSVPIKKEEYYTCKKKVSIEKCTKFNTTRECTNVDGASISADYDTNDYTADFFKGVGQVIAINEAPNLFGGTKLTCEKGVYSNFDWATDPMFIMDLIPTIGGYFPGVTDGTQALTAMVASSAGELGSLVGVGEQFGAFAECMDDIGLGYGDAIGQIFTDPTSGMSLDKTFDADSVSEGIADCEELVNSEAAAGEISGYLPDMSETLGSLSDAMPYASGALALADGDYSGGLTMAAGYLPPPYDILAKITVQLLFNTFEDCNQCTDFECAAGHDPKDAPRLYKMMQGQKTKILGSENNPNGIGENLEVNYTCVRQRTSKKSRCVSKILGQCIRRAEDHCCYNGIVTRILVTQIYQQLGRSFAEQKDANGNITGGCQELKLDDLENINWSSCSPSNPVPYAGDNVTGLHTGKPANLCINYGELKDYIVNKVNWDTTKSIDTSEAAQAAIDAADDLAE